MSTTANNTADLTPQPPPSEPGSFSRRGFLKGAGLTAAGGVLASTGLAGLAGAEPLAPLPSAVGPGRTLVTLLVNGARRTAGIEPRQTLAQVLRDELHLTGTKVVCDRGACSACTVWLDDEAYNSCMTLAVEVGARRVTTIEGLTPAGGALHPVQEAFVAYDAMQCGFCTPGMVMSCANLLQHNPKPSLEEVQTALAGNLCRCGTYPKIFEAVLAVAQAGYSPTPTRKG